MEEWLKILVFFLFAFGGCTYCYLTGRRHGFSRGYQSGYYIGLKEGVHGEEGKAMIEMLRTNVAKKVEEKIRAEYRNGERKP